MYDGIDGGEEDAEIDPCSELTPLEAQGEPLLAPIPSPVPGQKVNFDIAVDMEIGFPLKYLLEGVLS